MPPPGTIAVLTASLPAAALVTDSKTIIAEFPDTAPRNQMHPCC
jgi:hypothetical protein